MKESCSLRTVLTLVAVLLAGLVFQSESRAQSLPNLVINKTRLASSITFDIRNFTRNDCAVQEGAVLATGKRTLIRFDVSAANRGTADMFLGKPADHPELFYYSPCHRHYHFTGYATYELLNSSNTVVLTGRKQAFCLEDFEVDSPTAGPAKYTCSNQGISVGWADTYGSYLDGQWLDITGLPPGPYTLRVIINPYNVLRAAGGTLTPAETAMANAIPESDYTDNGAVIPVTIPTRIK